MFSLFLLSPLPQSPVPAISMPGVWEMVVILVIVLLIFGPKNLPHIGEALGKSIRGFKKAVKNEEEIDVTPTVDQLPEGSQRTSIPSSEEQKSRQAR